MEEKADEAIEELRDTIVDPVDEPESAPGSPGLQAADADEDMDLFGAQSDEEQIEAQTGGSPEDIFGAISDDEQAIQQDEEPMDVTMEVKLPKYDNAVGDFKETYTVRVPAFLSVQPQIYDEEKHLGMDEFGSSSGKELLAQVRHRVENTIRWRRTADSQVQSNARIVRWSDGSQSLQVGQEFYDITVSSSLDNVVAVARDKQGVLDAVATVKDSLVIVPTSTASHTHKLLVQAVQQRQLREKSATVGSFATTVDPELAQREIEKLEMHKLRARRKLEAKRRKEEESQSDFYSASRGEASTTAQRYETDDFVVSSEEESEEDGDDLDAVDEEAEEQRRAERLQQVKRKGEQMYRKAADDEDDENNEEEDEEEEAAGTSGSETAADTDATESNQGSPKESADGPETAESAQGNSTAASRRRRLVVDDDDDEE
ncbi:hypothetical protein CANCADRAFT_42339 [Tortispora caseinolytica NRRL Y-17796]|uniref:Leo1-like protein n=1 Tax=Tortispora caseinolytica NRRL Y-17796 TaxID=767744 RepID=A0A1E4TIY6_9ASCO|nr:hypothetical protein CANCADRAFT_42339 [Tortispora caseinolytica NRRL Y-17796]